MDFDPRIYVFDLDNTLTITRARDHHVTGEKKDWKAFNAACDTDSPHPQMRSLLLALFRERRGPRCDRANLIWIWTGRPSTYLDITVKWLERHSFLYDELRMKPEARSSAHANTIKGEWLAEAIAAGQRPYMVFDDRTKCVDWWRASGVVCADVAGNSF